jgi:CRP/FNR family transcriptional regulator
MTRDEIGEYLGMKLETVSRMLSKFQHKVVAAQGKQIRIVDSAGLGQI